MTSSASSLEPTGMRWRRWLGRPEEILRSRSTSQPPIRTRHLLLTALVFGILYGAVMGTFSGLAADRWQQIVYSAVKVPLLVIGAFALSLPSFYVFNAIMGLSRDFPAAVRGLAAAQSGMTIILASFAPLTAFWYVSFSGYQSALAFNGMMFAAASFAAQVLLRRHYGPLIAKDARHRGMLLCWLAVYFLVAIQLAWLMRPFVGDPAREPQFFRPDAFERNAYEVVFRVASDFLFGPR